MASISGIADCEFSRCTVNVGSYEGFGEDEVGGCQLRSERGSCVVNWWQIVRRQVHLKSMVPYVHGTISQVALVHDYRQLHQRRFSLRLPSLLNVCKDMSVVKPTGKKKYLALGLDDLLDADNTGVKEILV